MSENPTCGGLERDLEGPPGTYHNSPNCESRNGAKIDLIVAHATATDNFESVRAWFMNPSSQRSAHYVIEKDGRLHQFVDESKRAWHCRGMNRSSIGIEAVSGGAPLTLPQRTTFLHLVNYLFQKYGLHPEEVLEHHEVYGAHTLCPNGVYEGVLPLTESVT